MKIKYWRYKVISLLLQIWAGIFYLLNKIFFSQAERSKNNIIERKWRISSWIVYLIGLPGWVIIFIFERNWIAAAIESGGAPAMLIGLIIALRGKGKEPKWLDYVARIAILFGISYSLYDFGGITTINQIFELAIVSGFLIGTYLLAKKNRKGYSWFVLMNIACALLMYIESYPWLMLQQIISLVFVIDAYRMSKKK